MRMKWLLFIFLYLRQLMIQSVLLLELNPEIGKNPVRPSSQTPLLQQEKRSHRQEQVKSEMPQKQVSA